MPGRGIFRILAALAGLGLLLWMLSRFDLAAILDQTLSVGIPGFILIVLIYGLEFLSDVLAWQLTLPGIALHPRHLPGLFRIRLVGEALNTLTPLGGMGGEPIKALLLNQQQHIDYPQAGASLVLAKTLNVFALVIFLAIGFLLMLGDARIPEQLQLLASTGLAALTVGISAFLFVQHLRISSRGMRRLASRRMRIIERLAEFDERLIEFYRRRRRRCLSALLLGILNWVIGALGVMVSLRLMGYPLSFRDAWIIEAMTQMVRAAMFFIPASIGVQEGLYVLVAGALTGDAGLGLAAALVRRGREIVWVALGLAVGWPYLRKSEPQGC